jgi:hypothetical protein
LDRPNNPARREDCSVNPLSLLNNPQVCLVVAHLVRPTLSVSAYTHLYYRLDGSDLTLWHLHLFSRISGPRRDQVLQEELSELLPGLLGSNNRLDQLSELQAQRAEDSLEELLLVSLSPRTQTFLPYTTSS